MNLDELQSVRDRERQTDKLQQLRESFYEDAGGFIQQLDAERARAAERADNPFDSPQVQQLTDEINTAEQTVEAIYEKRIGKLVKAASLDAAGLPSEADGLTAEEQDLFETLVSDIKAHRTRVLDVLDGEVPDATDARGDRQESTTSREDGGVSAADVMGGGPERPETTREQDSENGGREPDIERERGDGAPLDNREPASANTRESTPPGQFRERPPAIHETSEQAEPQVRNDGGRDTTPETETHASADTQASSSADASRKIERETILVTEDVGTFVGFDGRDYDLSSNDVVTLPTTNADLLVKQDVAHPLD